MTRFHIVALVTAVLAVIMGLLHHFIFLGAIIFVFLVVMGLGVALPQLRFFGNFICRGNKTKKQIALTFDDGPDPKSTPQLLELLRERKIPATFFCIGKRVEASPEIAAQIRREGHLLENHSYTHSYFTNFYSAGRLKAELELAQAAIKKAASVTPNYFRPPVGLSNPNTFRVAKKLNLQVIGWSVRSLDTVIREPEKIVARVKRGLHPGAIILLHDGNIPAEKLLTTVKLLLDTLQKLGYEVVRLDELPAKSPANLTLP
jgi:peptidoglycan/xylan/chitin deacetylase (PgdA/CDA1 family)